MIRRPFTASRFALSALTGLALVLGVAACDRDAEKAAAPPANTPAPNAAVTPADAAAPFEFKSKTAFADVSLTLPQTLKAQPDLHARLYADAVKDLRAFNEGAQADRTEAGGDGGAQPYEKTVTYASTVETGKLVSLARQAFEYSGGAHGNTVYAGVIWDKALKRTVSPAALFRPGADLSALDRALCAAVNAAKRERGDQGPPLTLGKGTADGGAAGWSCPTAITTPFVLTPSATTGKAAGLTFLIGPYLVGPYVEGGYEVTVPHGAFHALLAPAYGDEFAGEPVSARTSSEI